MSYRKFYTNFTLIFYTNLYKFYINKIGESNQTKQNETRKAVNLKLNVRNRKKAEITTSPSLVMERECRWRRSEIRKLLMSRHTVERLVIRNSGSSFRMKTILHPVSPHLCIRISSLTSITSADKLTDSTEVHLFQQQAFIKTYLLIPVGKPPRHPAQRQVAGVGVDVIYISRIPNARRVLARHDQPIKGDTVDWLLA